MEIGGVLRTVFQIEVGREKALAFDLVTTLPRHVLKWGGRISAAIRQGNRPQEDERNRLILPGINALEKLQPDWFILENVRRMENTVIRNEKNEPENILQCLARVFIRLAIRSGRTLWTSVPTEFPITVRG